MHLVVSPDLSPVIRAKNEALARVPTRKVTHHSTRIRDNSRGISSDTSRSLSLDVFIHLSRGNSRGVFIEALHNTSIQDGIHTSLDKTYDHSAMNSIPDLRPKGAMLDVYYQVESPKWTDTHDAFLTGRIFRSRTEVFSDQERKNFPPNNIQRKRSRELRCS